MCTKHHGSWKNSMWGGNPQPKNLRATAKYDDLSSKFRLEGVLSFLFCFIVLAMSLPVLYQFLQRQNIKIKAANDKNCFTNFVNRFGQCSKLNFYVMLVMWRTVSFPEIRVRVLEIRVSGTRATFESPRASFSSVALRDLTDMLAV